MPQMVALFNGFGGGAAALVSALEYRHLADRPGALPLDSGISILLGALIGAVSFTGSVVAFGKLQGIFTEQADHLPAAEGRERLAVSRDRSVLGWMVLTPERAAAAVLIAFLAAWRSCSACSLVIPIGGGDMPVVISLLNSFTGLAAAATGFALHNDG